MTARVLPYQNKPSAHWIQLKTELTSTKFFLVNRNGPVVFTLRDEHAATFKVTLGNPHTCSCENNNGDFCIHVVFCLLKVLRINDKHALSYQLGFTDAETTLVLSGSCCSRDLHAVNGSNGNASSGGGEGGGSPIMNRSAAARMRRLQARSASSSSAAAAAAAATAEENDFVQRQPLNDSSSSEVGK